MTPITDKLSRRLALVLTALAAMIAANAQSPYSKFGYGLLRDNATAAQRQMGGVGYAMANGRQINVMNPASYALRDTLTFIFDMGLDFSAIHSSEKGVSQKDYGGGLDYITMQFPLFRHVGMSIGLLPWSSVGYAFGSTIDNGSSSRQGSGGINLLYAGIGYNPFKGFSLGANIAYMFGTTYNDVYATPSNVTSTSLFEQVMQVRDWHLDLGVQYAFEPAPRHKLTAGLTFSPGKSLNGRLWIMQYDNAVNTAYTSSVGDTIRNERMGSHFSIPCTWGAGINYEWNRRVMAEVDFTYQPWSKARYAEFDDFIATTFQNRWRLGAGASWQPDPRGGFFKRMLYRAGAYYNHDYLQVNGNSVREYGIGCGLGIPAIAGRTLVNLGFEYKRRQSSPVRLVTEDYFNITLGINFNERWFMQSKLR